MEADLFDLFGVSRGGSGDSMGDVGVLDGAKYGCLNGARE